jgi:hypothetical protein
MKTRRRKTTKLRHRKEATASRSRGSSAGGLQEQLDLCTRELNEAQRKLDLRTRALSEALDQQKATSEVLRVISNSPIDLPSALGAIAESAARLLDVTDADIKALQAAQPVPMTDSAHSTNPHSARIGVSFTQS